MRHLAPFLILIASACATEPDPPPEPLEMYPWPGEYGVRWERPTIKVGEHGEQGFVCDETRCDYVTRDYLLWVTQKSYWSAPHWMFGPAAHEFETSIPTAIVGDPRLHVFMPGTVAHPDTPYGARQDAQLVVDDAGVWRGRIQWLTTSNGEPTKIEIDLVLEPR